MGVFSDGRRLGRENGGKIEIEQNLAQVEAPSEDGVVSGCRLRGNSTPPPSRQSLGNKCGHG